MVNLSTILPRATLTASFFCFMTIAGTVIAQDCPPTFGNGQLCTAKDFTVSSVVISGPDECTEGETVSMNLRVGLESTARQRYDIGFFVGDNGGQVIDGASCSHTSLAPIEPTPPFNPNSGVGGYRDLEGDACGDIDNADGIIYHNFQLDSVLCRDEDGDGQVDISGLVTWSSNANQDVCPDPSVPSNFFPTSSSKCQLAPDLNIPIIVEPPPTMTVIKAALPSSLPAPGGPVVFLVGVRNTSVSTDPITLTSLIDNVHGDLNGRGNCSVPQSLVPGQIYICEFVATVSGSAGFSETDTVTLTAMDDDGDVIVEMDSATVVITSAPPSMIVKKDASPSSLPEPGGSVTYSVLVGNTSDTENITVTDIQDDIYGSVIGRGNCPTGNTVLAPGAYFICSFDEMIVGRQPGDTVTDIVTASAEDTGGTPLSDSDTATVHITDVAASIEAKKYAVPHQLPEPGGLFTFNLAVQNSSPVDAVTIDSMTDNIYGDLTGITGSTCVAPQVLQPSDIYECSFPGEFLGSGGAFQVDSITVSATDDDGFTQVDIAYAQVFITHEVSSIDVIKTATPAEAVSGDTVTFNVMVVNTSEINIITINNLNDDIYGDITTVAGSISATNCSTPQILSPGDSYQCDFQASVNGTVGSVVTDVVLAQGVDDNLNAVSNTDFAEVLIVDSPIVTPELKVTKVAVPSTIKEPGGLINYLILVHNPSTSSLRITSLLDDIYDVQGDDSTKEAITSQVACAPGFVLAPGERHLCMFIAPVNGAAGDTVTDTITAEACVEPACGPLRISASDDATVSITEGPASIVVQKSASPTTVTEPGGAVTFTVSVINNSTSAVVTIDTLVDSIYGDITTDIGNIDSTSCTTPQSLAAGDSYQCDFTTQVSGTAVSVEVDLVTASGSDDDGNLLSESDIAVVFILGTPPRISITKTANPDIVAAPGGIVTFTVSVQNTSATENLTLNTLVDDVFGDLNGRGNCELPQILAVGQVYSCEFPGNVSGTSSDLHADTITLSATDESGDTLTDEASAYVFIRVVSEALDIPISSTWWLLLSSLCLSIAGLRALRHRYQ